METRAQKIQRRTGDSSGGSGGLRVGGGETWLISVGGVWQVPHGRGSQTIPPSSIPEFHLDASAGLKQIAIDLNQDGLPYEQENGSVQA